MSDNNYNTAEDVADDGTFEIRLRLLSNEVFALSISADPLSSQWVSWAVLIAFLTIFGLGLFGQPLANFYNSLVNAEQGTLNVDDSSPNN